eukprot:454057-Hanusia_phi.AAC.1
MHATRAVVIRLAQAAIQVAIPVVARVAHAVAARRPLDEAERGRVVRARTAGSRRGHQVQVRIDGAGLARLGGGRVHGLEGAHGAGRAGRCRRPVVAALAYALAQVVRPGLEGVGVCGAGRAGSHSGGDIRVGVERTVLAAPRGVVEGPHRAGDTVAEGIAVAGHVTSHAGALEARCRADRMQRAGLAEGDARSGAVRQEGVRRACPADSVGGRVLVVTRIAGPAATRPVRLVASLAEAFRRRRRPVVQGCLVKPAQAASPADGSPGRRAVSPGHAGSADPNPGGCLVGASGAGAAGDPVRGRVVSRKARARGHTAGPRGGVGVGRASLAAHLRGCRREGGVGVGRAGGTATGAGVLARPALQARVPVPLVARFAKAAGDGPRARERLRVDRAWEALAGVGDPLQRRVRIGSAGGARRVGDGGLVVASGTGEATKAAVEAGEAREAQAGGQNARSGLRPRVAGACRAFDRGARTVRASWAELAERVPQRGLDQARETGRAAPKRQLLIAWVAQTGAQADGGLGGGGCNRKGLVRPGWTLRAAPTPVRRLVLTIPTGGAVWTRIPWEAIAGRQCGRPEDARVPPRSTRRASPVAHLRLVGPWKAGHALAVHFKVVPAVALTGGDADRPRGNRRGRQRASRAGCHVHVGAVLAEPALGTVDPSAAIVTGRTDAGVPLHAAGGVCRGCRGTRATALVPHRVLVIPGRTGSAGRAHELVTHVADAGGHVRAPHR